MPEIEITGPSTARGIWAMVDYGFFAESDGRLRRAQGWGHYRENYVKQDGRWYISALVLTKLRSIDGTDELLPIRSLDWE